MPPRLFLYLMDFCLMTGKITGCAEVLTGCAQDLTAENTTSPKTVIAIFVGDQGLLLVISLLLASLFLYLTELSLVTGCAQDLAADNTSSPKTVSAVIVGDLKKDM